MRDSELLEAVSEIKKRIEDFIAAEGVDGLARLIVSATNMLIPSISTDEEMVIDFAMSAMIKSAADITMAESVEIVCCDNCGCAIPWTGKPIGLGLCEQCDLDKDTK